MTDDAKSSWYSISAEYKPIPSELRPGRGEWYLQATLIHEYRDLSGGIQTEKTPLGSIDVDHIDSVELRQAFYAVTDEALDALQLPLETREQIAAELRLVMFTRRRDIMGTLVNRPLTTAVAIACSAAILGLNLWLLGSAFVSLLG